MIDHEAIWQADVCEMPFKFFVAENLVKAEQVRALHSDFPRIEQPGAFPVQELEYGQRRRPV